MIAKLLTPRAARKNSGIKNARNCARSAHSLGRRKFQPDIRSGRTLLRELYGTAYRGRTGLIGGGICK